jgi:hypothetical protein
MKSVKKFHISYVSLHKALKLPDGVEIAAVKADPTDTALVVTIVDTNGEMPQFIDYDDKPDRYYGVTR